MCPVRPARDRERGAIAVLMALLMTVIMGFAALGFDLAYVRLARLEMANATDAAAHAAAVALSASGAQDIATTAAITVAGMNSVLGRSVVLTSSDLVFGTYNFTTKTFNTGGTPATAVQVVGHTVSGGDGFVNLTFGRIFGTADAYVTENATAASMNRYFQIELQTSDDWICEIDNAASAAVQLGAYLNGPNGYQGDWIGLDVFTGVSRPMTALMNVRQHWALDIAPVWTPNISTLGTQVGAGPPYSAANFNTVQQSGGISVCSKANAVVPAVVALGTFAGITNSAGNQIGWPGGYRQCPGANPPVVPVAPTAQQFPFPNHNLSFTKLYCSDGGQPGLYAGTDLAAAITAGSNELLAVGMPNEPRTLILITDGTPMSCTGIGGGGLCGHTYGGDGATPPAGSGMTTSSYWNPCCANGLTCGGTYTVTDAKGNSYSYGGGPWGDGSPSNSPNGSTACTTAHSLVQAAVTAADNAAANNISIYVIGFFKNPDGSVGTGISPNFVSGLVRNGTATITNDSTAIAGILKSIPAQVPVSIVR
jgi:Flp pilus assembly protein TadG